MKKSMTRDMGVAYRVGGGMFSSVSVWSGGKMTMSISPSVQCGQGLCLVVCV